MTRRFRRRWRVRDANALSAFEQAVELVEHTDAAPGKGGQGRTGDAHVRKRSKAEDEAGIEDQVDDVRDPEQAHGDGCIACAAKDGVVEEQHDDGAAAAERDARVARAAGDDGRRCAHELKQLRREDAGRDADGERDEQTEDNGLHSGDGGVIGILLADAPGHHGAGGHGDAEADGEDQRQHGLGDAHGGHGVCAEAADPEDVDDGEKGFEHHLKHHGNGEQEDGAVEVAGGVVLVGAAQGFPN
jgi:hypothetical protein